MAKNRHADGHTIDFQASSDVKSGDLIILGSMVGVALSDVDSDDTGTASTTGVWELAKDTGFSIEQGDLLYAKNGSVVAHDEEDDEQVLAGTAWMSSAGSSTVAVVKVNTGY